MSLHFNIQFYYLQNEYKRLHFTLCFVIMGMKGCEIMARNTKKDLRKMMLYQVYVRNYSEDGTFNALTKDLDRIKDLGTDILYLLPVHPIGKKNRKGILGSPYSIQDYREINDELGTMDDFKNLIQETHEKGMKLMMDIVFNHTSYDSWLFENKKEWFYQNEKGEYTNRVADWWDITDLDYSKDKALWDYLIETLVMYTKMGVDGFRFDVANILPLKFLEEAREAVLKVNPDSIWLSETTHGFFTKTMRDKGFMCLSEGEIFNVFDMAYDYDLHPFFEGYLKKEKPLERYVEFLNTQDEIYPDNYIKMRNLDNHDFGRIAGMVSNEDTLKAWHALNFFLKGSKMLYMGAEYSHPKLPDLFNKDVITRNGEDLSGWIKTLSQIAKTDALAFGAVEYSKDRTKDVIIIRYHHKSENYLGIFNVNQEEGLLELSIPDGNYIDLLSEKEVQVNMNQTDIPKSAIIFKL